MALEKLLTFISFPLPCACPLLAIILLCGERVLTSAHTKTFATAGLLIFCGVIAFFGVLFAFIERFIQLFVKW
jgi:hypothetical protein